VVLAALGEDECFGVLVGIDAVEEAEEIVYDMVDEFEE
jgi:hypothetical protein